MRWPQRRGPPTRGPRGGKGHITDSEAMHFKFRAATPRYSGSSDTVTVPAESPHCVQVTRGGRATQAAKP